MLLCRDNPCNARSCTLRRLVLAYYVFNSPMTAKAFRIPAVVSCVVSLLFCDTSCWTVDIALADQLGGECDSISCLRGMLQKPARTPEVRLIARVTFRSRYIRYFDFESTWLENERSTSPSTFGSD